MNTLKKRALLDVVKFVCFSVGGALAAIWVIKTVPPEVTLYSACAVGLGFMLKTIYQIRLETHTFKEDYLHRELVREQNKPIANYCSITGKPLMAGYPVYTEEPKREWVGLTKEERRSIFASCESEDMGYVLAMTEAKLKEKNTNTVEYGVKNENI